MFSNSLIFGAAFLPVLYRLILKKIKRGIIKRREELKLELVNFYFKYTCRY